MTNRNLAVALSLVLPFVLSAESVAAKPKPTATVSSSNSAKTKTGKSEWLLPKANTIAKAGSTITLKFTIAENRDGSLVTDVNRVTVTSRPTGCPVTVPSPRPTATGSLAFVNPGKSSVGTALRFTGNSFMQEWKTLKKADDGCYQFTATLTGAGAHVFPGPIVQIVAAG